MIDLSKVVRQPVVMSIVIHDKLKSLAKRSFLTQGDVINVLIDTVTPEQIAALEKYRVEKVENRVKELDARNKVKGVLRSLTVEQMNYLASLK